MTRSEDIKELVAALVKAQAKMTGAMRNSENPHFRSKYADLASVREACFSALNSEGLSILQAPSSKMRDGGLFLDLETLLMHTSGQFISDILSVPVTKPDAQGVGSAISYARRYALSAFTGVAPEDDDGNAAVGNGQAKAKQESALPKPQGYDQWLDDLKATADEGTEAVRAAWLASGKDVRAYLSATSPKELDAIRAKAAKAGVTA
jgi:hypothetical protein